MTQTEALNILKTGANVFLTGEPGAGKTYTINQYVSYLNGHDVSVAITASTGIASTHIGGMTIHSFSGIGIKKYLDKYELDKIVTSEYVSKRVRKAQVLVVDEVSMLNGTTLSMVDAVCREIRQNQTPFGGLQVVLIGDFFQLPPIEKKDESHLTQNSFLEKEGRFAYESGVWDRARFITCYLSEQHRQSDKDFLSVLSAIRKNEFSEEHFSHIEKRIIDIDGAPEDLPKLFSHNLNVDFVNDQKLQGINEKENIFEMESSGNPNLVATLKKGCLSPEILKLKIGAKVMFTKNNPKESYVNGTLGEVVDFDRTTLYPIVRIKNGYEIYVEPMDFSVEENGKIKAKITQIPLRLAWAITVHKSQGMSLDGALMDLSQVFEYGQGYVALSRVRTLSGLYILGVNDQTFLVHPEVLKKDVEFRSSSESAKDAFSKIQKNELQKMHANFILASGGKLVKVKKQKNKDTHEETLALFKEGRAIEEIAKERGFAVATIFDHIEKLFEDRKIFKEDIESIVNQKLEKDIDKIKKAFNSFDDKKLTPVFEKLSGKYSYNELRIVRMLLG